MIFQPGDKVVCVFDFGGHPNFIHPNGPPPMGPILCVESAGVNPITNTFNVTIVGYPVLNFTKKHLAPRPVGYGHEGFRKIVPASERAVEKLAEPVK